MTDTSTDRSLLASAAVAVERLDSVAVGNNSNTAVRGVSSTAHGASAYLQSVGDVCGHQQQYRQCCKPAEPDVQPDGQAGALDRHVRQAP